MIDKRQHCRQPDGGLDESSAGVHKARWRPVILGSTIGLALAVAIAVYSFLNPPGDTASVSATDAEEIPVFVEEDPLIVDDDEAYQYLETPAAEMTIHENHPPSSALEALDVLVQGSAHDYVDRLDEGAASASAITADEYAPLKDGFGEGSAPQSKAMVIHSRGARRSGAARGYGATKSSEIVARDREQRVIEGRGGRVDEQREVAAEAGRDNFADVRDNPFMPVAAQPLSTFSIDVDTAVYSLLRNRILSESAPLPPHAIRIEELINYFPYNYTQPADGTPFAVHVDVAACPWQTKHRLARIALKGREIPKEKRPPSNLVFLVDVSGSMDQPNKLPLVRIGLVRLVDQLDERDRVAIVVYAGQSGCVLPSTVCTEDNKTEIKDAIRTLTPGGSTNGESGIVLAYQIAKDHFVPKGANRVILCTDGDWNVGTTDTDSLKKLVADRAKAGVFLSALGFGMGNLNDHMLEQIADNGNGVYGYIDDEGEIEKLFVKQLSGTLVTIAKDVKIQVEFNPAAVAGYRLIGYENRILAKVDFNDDKKDAGDIGAGHTVTALYEIVPAGVAIETPEGAAATPSVDDLEFQQPKKKEELEPTEKAKTSGDMLLVKLRYKEPDGDKSTLIKHPVKDGGGTFAAAGEDFRFAAAVAAFGMTLRGSPFKGDISLATVEEIASAAVGEDKDRHRREFVDLVKRARTATGGGPER